MIKRRDPVSINSVGEYLLLCSDELKNAEILLNKHINDINTHYKGVDAKIIVSKFLDSSSKMETMIANLKYYGQYFKTLSNHDKENLELATKQFQDLLDETFNLNNPLSLNDDINIDAYEVEHVWYYTKKYNRWSFK